MVSAFSHQQINRGGVRGRPFKWSCRSIVLRQDELDFKKDISTLQVSLALLKLMLAMARRKKPAVAAGGHTTTPGSRTRASEQRAGMR